MNEKDELILPCPKCGKEFRIINPNDKINIYSLAVIDCKCGEMLEYSQITKKLERV